jgi:3'-phosphoadenosine 5'-phosphosulfate sulfotransferase
METLYMPHTNDVKQKVRCVRQWDRAIQDAKTKLEMAKLRVVRLTEIVDNLETMKAAGEPWPREGKNNANNAATR